MVKLASLPRFARNDALFLHKNKIQSFLTTFKINNR